MKNMPIHIRYSNRHQRGVALLVSLIVLIVMTLAGVALVRSVDTGVLAAGNLAFRQGATHAGQKGIEEARTWLMNQFTANPANLYTDQVGYRAAEPSILNKANIVNFTGNENTPPVNWDDDTLAKCSAKDPQGNTVCYIVHRLCNYPGEPGKNDFGGTTLCSSVPGGTIQSHGQGALQQMGSYQKGGITITGSMAYYYRITVRVAGPRNTYAYLQAFVVI